jgi:cytochrome c553
MMRVCSRLVRLRLAASALLAACALGCQQPNAAPPAAAPVSADEIAALKAEVQTVRDRAVTASTAMADVGFHWANLWFAGQHGNWPLATYYFNEARNHVRWLIRINPTPKGPDGERVDLKGIFDAIDTSSFADVKAAIDAKDGARFVAAYRTALESCYSCHKSVGRPYLRPTIPETVPQPIINLDPNAQWPK